MAEPVQVYEHGVLRIGEPGLPEPVFERLAAFNERHGNCYFTLGHRRVHFTQYVGVVQVGQTVIEILPKIDGVPGTEDKALWHNVLVKMLQRCGLFRVEAPTTAPLDCRHASLLDLYLGAFLREVEALAHHGLVKKYRRAQENLRVFKGRLLVAQQLRHNLIHRERTCCEYTAYDRDNVFNRVLKQALGVVRDTAPSATLADGARRLLLALDGIAEESACAETFQRLRYDRNTERYRRAMVLAELIILNYAPDIRCGVRNVLAILFDMNALFERYAFCELRRAARTLGDQRLHVTGQVSKTFWRAESAEARIRPDILVELGGAESSQRIVLDTKWKLPRNGCPTAADLQQMYTYNLQFEAAESILLYPRTGGAQDAQGQFMEPGSVDRLSSHGCGMWFGDILEDGTLDLGFGERLARRLLESAVDLRL